MAREGSTSIPSIITIPHTDIVPFTQCWSDLEGALVAQRVWLGCSSEGLGVRYGGSRWWRDLVDC